MRRPGERAKPTEPMHVKDSNPVENAFRHSGSDGIQSTHKTGTLSQGFVAVPQLVNVERHIEFFKRVFKLPIEVEADKVTTKLEARLLSLNVPKHHATCGKGTIAVESVE
ncbi:hypothetical protein LTR56_027669 [Elasticomyces elasticus]|nr:hypothetical protein LTR56_027669 [Elasticomyces elasticus]KAK3614607.1 hypothetical protein LTR22_027722 [Elasticomyces elasticus]KAK4895060.1 hypothetical protein LTR49_028324 [Elasticomyces elasticus]KAK5731939.1 hypothetical protein LTS12_027197 [Elasticomyces elasticus]